MNDDRNDERMTVNDDHNDEWMTVNYERTTECGFNDRWEICVCDLRPGHNRNALSTFVAQIRLRAKRRQNFYSIA